MHPSSCYSTLQLSTLSAATSLVCLFLDLANVANMIPTRPSTSDDLGFMITDSVLQSHPVTSVSAIFKHRLTDYLLRRVVSIVFEVLSELYGSVSVLTDD